MAAIVRLLLCVSIPAAVGLLVAPNSPNRLTEREDLTDSDGGFDHNHSVYYASADLSWDPLLFEKIEWSGHKLLCMMKKQMYWKAKYAWPFMRKNPSVFPRDGFPKCAAVSSSGVLNAHQYGAAIDKADLVVRFNDAPSGGVFRSRVGLRDDMRYVSHKFTNRVLWRKSPRYHYKPATLIGVTHGYPERLWQFRRHFPRNNLYRLNGNLWKSLRAFLRSAYRSHWFYRGGVSYTPTTGGTGMVALLYLCKEIRAYGFAATPKANRYPYHFFDGEQDHAAKNDWHKTFSAEKDLWRRLASNSAWHIDKSDIAVIKGFRSLECPTR